MNKPAHQVLKDLDFTPTYRCQIGWPDPESRLDQRVLLSRCKFAPAVAYAYFVGADTQKTVGGFTCGECIEQMRVVGSLRGLETL